MEQENKILTGTIWKQILLFFFPILIGTFFQQLYNTVDAVIVGRFAGTTALAAVGGSASIIINLIVGFFTGLSAGCTVLISQFFGADKKKELQDSLHTTYAFGLIGGVIFGLIGFLTSPAIMKVMNTPVESMSESVLYVRIYFAGLIFVFIYNMGAAVLRALGDSKHPLFFLIICSFVNIILDLILVVVFHLGVLGVAVATLLSQAVSAVLVTLWLMKYTKEVQLYLSEIKLHFDLLKKMLQIGLPSGIQSSTYNISNMIIQAAINLYGVNATASWAAVGKVDVIFWMINGSFGIAATTFVGQNFGAKYYDRVKKGTRSCLSMAVVTALVVSAFLLTIGKSMLWLFTTNPEVVEIGKEMMNVIVPGYVIFAFIEILSASLRAQGDTLIPTIINILLICVFRAIWIFSLKGVGSLSKIILCYPVSWLICAAAIIWYYISRRKKFG